MAQSQPTRLLTTRPRTGAAIGLTGLVFALAIRNVLHLGHRRGWLLPVDFLLHGWFLIGANVVFYGYLCWLAFWIIRGTKGRERIVMVGWFSAILLSPLEILQHGWAMEIRCICVLGLAVALLSAVSLLLRPAAASDAIARTGQ